MVICSNHIALWFSLSTREVMKCLLALHWHIFPLVLLMISNLTQNMSVKIFCPVVKQFLPTRQILLCQGMDSVLHQHRSDKLAHDAVQGVSLSFVYVSNSNEMQGLEQICPTSATHIALHA